MIRRRGVEYAYSIAALYSGTYQELTRMGMFLQGSDGKIIAAHVEPGGAKLCDGCGMPTFDEGIERVYPVENMFTAPTFPYPLLMLDASTVEGRSIELVTFSSSREISRHFFYEYVVGCFH